MTRRLLGATLALALAALGCQSTVAPLPTTDQAGGAEPRYRVLGGPGEAMATVTASSEENSWHPVSHVTDGVLTSAWAPRWDDEAPSLTMDLAAETMVSGVTVKLSPQGATVKVEAWDGEAWVVLAEGVEPTEATLHAIDVDDTMTTKLRLTFGGVSAGDLYVCEVRADVAAASPTPAPSGSPSAEPTASPTASPTAEPTASPTAEPTASPTASPTAEPTASPTASPSAEPSTEPEPCDCKVTGGGFVYLPGQGEPGKKDKVTFGFVAMTNPGQGEHGNITVLDHKHKDKYGGRVDAIRCDGNTVSFSGTLRKSGAAFTATVTDNGEPGTNDTFSFATEGFTIDGKLGDGGPGGGNIQVHKPNCD